MFSLDAAQTNTLSPRSAWRGGDLERPLSLRSFLNNRLTNVLERCRLVLSSATFCSFCCFFFFFCLSSKDGNKYYDYINYI